MTDALAALSAAFAAELPCRDALMQEYDDKWHQDGLVMDKWFILQSTSPAANVVKNRTRPAEAPFVHHEQPEPRPLSNWCLRQQQPGRVPCRRRQRYQFMVEMLTELNSRNPQVASRLIEPLIRLKSNYDAQRRGEKIRAPRPGTLKGLENLSGELHGKMHKALA